MNLSGETMTCREASSLLLLFLDGELDARQMRAVALHGTRCAACETELRQFERLQDLIGDTIHTRLEEIDFSTFWSGVEKQLIPTRKPIRDRLVRWWNDFEWSRGWAWPAFAAAAAAVIFALLMFTRMQPSVTNPEAPQVATADNSVSIDSLDADGSVAVVNDPETHTTVLWVSDDSVVEDAQQ